jgi:7-cyano-7-deazaguanine synthase
MNHDLVILYSGGADSRLMLEFAKEFGLNPFCVLVDYGQIHQEELRFAKSHLEKLMIDYQLVFISGLQIDSGLTGNGIKNETGEVHEMHVPGRNTMFLSVAYSIAESRGIDTIWLGSDWDDRLNLFPDCYQEYIVAMNELFKLAGPKPIAVEAPLSGISKVNIMTMLKRKGVDESEIFSGYGGL